MVICIKTFKIRRREKKSCQELEKDLHFGLKTVEEGTTAKPEEYRLEKEYTFRKRALPTDMKEVKDTIEVSVLHSDRLAELGTKHKVSWLSVPATGWC